MDSVRSTAAPKKRANSTVGLLARSRIPWSDVAPPAGFEPALPPQRPVRTLIMPISGVSPFPFCLAPVSRGAVVSRSSLHGPCTSEELRRSCSGIHRRSPPTCGDMRWSPSSGRTIAAAPRVVHGRSFVARRPSRYGRREWLSPRQFPLARRRRHGRARYLTLLRVRSWRFWLVICRDCRRVRPG